MIILQFAMCYFLSQILINNLYYLKGVLSDLLVLCARHRVRSHIMDISVRHFVLVSELNVTTKRDVCSRKEQVRVAVRYSLRYC